MEVPAAQRGPPERWPRCRVAAPSQARPWKAGEGGEGTWPHCDMWTLQQLQCSAPWPRALFSLDAWLSAPLAHGRVTHRLNQSLCLWMCSGCRLPSTLAASAAPPSSALGAASWLSTPSRRLAWWSYSAPREERMPQRAS